MKQAIAAFLVILAVLHVAPGRTPDQRISINGRLNCPYISHNGGTVYLQISVAAPAIEFGHRQPMNLAVVLDRSGSMADEGKIEYAKKAVYALIDQLQEGDIFSFVIYDDVIQVLREARRVSDKRELRRLIDEVFPRGATNLGGGLIEGLHQVERYRDREYLNRVILLSDGLANRGITDPYKLRRIAQRYRAKSISVTTMGVGLDYNENLMVGLSESGGGNYYFIESPQSLASIFRKELKNLASVVAQNASIQLTLGEDVRVRDVIGWEHHREGDRVVIPLGDICGGEQRELTVELEVPEGTGTRTVAKGILRHDGKHGWFEAWPSFTAKVHYTRDFSEIDRNRDNDAQAKADVALSTRNVDRALRALDEGRREEAAKELQAAQAVVQSSPASLSAGAGGAILGEQKSKLESYQNLLKDSADARRAKKAIQFENYKTQKARQ